jgi:L-rhamnose mutarotase
MAEYVGQYDSAHAAVRPDLLAAIRKAGVSGWLVSCDGLDIFHSIECVLG